MDLEHTERLSDGVLEALNDARTAEHAFDRIGRSQEVHFDVRVRDLTGPEQAQAGQNWSRRIA